MSSAPISAVPAANAPFDTGDGIAALTSSRGGANANATDIDKVSKDFEAVFLSQMMGAMFEGDTLTQYFGGGTAGEIYKSFLLNEYGKSIAQSGGIGIASQVKKELLSLQEMS